MVVLCLGVAWGTSWIGFSNQIGAFVAGLMIAEVDHSEHTLGNRIQRLNKTVELHLKDHFVYSMRQGSPHPPNPDKVAVVVNLNRRLGWLGFLR